MGLDAAIDLGRHWRRPAGFAVQGGLLALSDEAFADTGDSVDVPVQGVGDVRIGAGSAGPAAVGEQEYVGMAYLFGRCLSVFGDVLQALPLLVGKLDGILVGGEQAHGMPPAKRVRIEKRKPYQPF